MCCELEYKGERVLNISVSWFFDLLTSSKFKQWFAAA